MKNAIKFLLAGLSLFGSAQALAQISNSLDQSAVKMNLGYSQQEHGVAYVELLAPTMGIWGRLGLNVGSSNYYLRDSLQETQLMTASQVGGVWSFDRSFIKLNEPSHNMQLGLATSLRYGQVVYGNLEGTERKTSRFNFIEMELAYQVHSVNKSDSADTWIRGSSLGIGVGIRNNLIRKPQTIGQTEVDPLRIYPTLQVGLHFF